MSSQNLLANSSKVFSRINLDNMINQNSKFQTIQSIQKTFKIFDTFSRVPLRVAEIAGEGKRKSSWFVTIPTNTFGMQLSVTT